MTTTLGPLLLGVLALGSAAKASPPGCTPVGPLPFRIVAPGHYCLHSNLVWPSEVGIQPGAAAIEIVADDVVLDLAGFRLLGPGDRGQLNGIQAWNREKITVRNGRVASFFVGVALRENGRAPARARGHLVEGLRVSRSGAAGVDVQGGGSRVVGNVVDGDGATGTAHAGIMVAGARQVVVDNDVIDLSGRPGREGQGIVVRDGPATVVQGNRVTGPGSGRGCGVSVSGSKGVKLVANRFAGLRADRCTGRAKGTADEP